MLLCSVFVALAAFIICWITLYEVVLSYNRKRLRTLPVPTSTENSSSRILTTLILATVAVTSFGSSAKADILTIGSGTSTSHLPLNTYYHDARMQVIYLASEIGGPCRITALALDVVIPPGQPLEKFSVRLKHTPLSSYSVNSWESGWTTSYGPRDIEVDEAGWFFGLSQPFDYDGVSNLMVDFSFNNSSYSTDGLCRYTSSSTVRSVYNRTYGGFGNNPLAWSGTSNPAPLSTSVVPNLRLLTQPLPPAETPSFSPPGGAYGQPLEVSLLCGTPGAVIHYTVDGSEPNQSDPSVTSGGKVPVDQSLTLKARVWSPLYPPSQVATAEYSIMTLPPVFSVQGGVYSEQQQVVVTCQTPGAVIRYTTNGNDPTESDAIVASGGSVTIPVAPSTTLKARAWSPYAPPSEITSATYIYMTAAPTFTPPAGKYENAQQVTLTSITTGAVIHYTMDGNDPTQSDPSVVSGGSVTVPVSPATTLKARAWALPMNPSPVVSGLYRESRVIRVSPDGNDTGDGSTWQAAKKSIMSAMAAAEQGDEIWVKAGTYFDFFVLKEAVRLFGGFSGTETERIQRNWNINKSILTGYSGNHIVTLPTGTTSRCMVDGFTIDGLLTGGIGINCYNTTATIRNNTITRMVGTGIHCGYASPTIINNVIIGNRGNGIVCHASNASIIGNVIAGNDVSETELNGGGINCNSGSVPIIKNNTIVANKAKTGGGIYSLGALPKVENNIIAWNTSSTGGGIGYYTGPPDHDGSKYLRNNCIYGNTSANYYGVSVGVNDISADPLFVNRQGGDYHLQLGSPCINAGYNAAVQPGWVDMDGQPRQNGVVDIGADEYWRFPQIATSGAKGLANGLPVRVAGAVVTAVFGDTFYMETADRSVGIMVQKAGHGMATGQIVSVEGTLATTSDDERYLNALVIATIGTASISPLSINNRTLGGEAWQLSSTGGQKGTKDSFGLNNIGLLIKTTGKITSVDSASGIFYLDDGSNRMDGSGSVGIRVKAGSITLPDVNDIVTVTGISSCYKTGNDLYPLIKLTATPLVVD